MLAAEACKFPSFSIETLRFDAISIQTEKIEGGSNSEFSPSLRSGSFTDIGPRSQNEDSHIQIDDLSANFDVQRTWTQPCAFYAVFDGHGGSDASAYLKKHAIRVFFDDYNLPEPLEDIDDAVLMEELKKSHCEAFLRADQDLAKVSSISETCGTTALTALVLGRRLLIANAGDCRAVLCRKGVAMQLSNDHRPSCVLEEKRVKDSGGFIEDGYLNGELAVTRSLGDWFMKLPFGSKSPLIAEPDVQHIMISEDDEFLIMGCDGLWDVLSNQEAVKIVRRELKQHGDPQRCAGELVHQALRRDTADNVTVIVVCFTSYDCDQDSAVHEKPRFRRFNLSEEARNRLKSLLEGN